MCRVGGEYIEGERFGANWKYFSTEVKQENTDHKEKAANASKPIGHEAWAKTRQHRGCAIIIHERFVDIRLVNGRLMEAVKRTKPNTYDFACVLRRQV